MLLPTAVAINIGVALHLFIAGLGVYLWTFHRRLHPAACIVAGLVFMFCGAHFLQIYRGHLHCLTTLAWAPLIFLAIDGVLRTFSVTWVLLGMVAVAMQILAGHVQYIFYTAIIAGIYALLGWLTSGRRLRQAVALASIYLGGASLAAVQLFTGLQAASESHRTGISYGVAASFCVPARESADAHLPRIVRGHGHDAVLGAMDADRNVAVHRDGSVSVGGVRVGARFEGGQAVQSHDGADRHDLRVR